MTTCENFGTYSHEQIRHEMYDGAGPNSQGDTMVGWHELAGRLTAVRQYVDSAVRGLQASQQGVAADAAAGAMIPLGSWVDEAQRLANDTRGRIDNQISEFTTARNNVPEVPPEPSGWGWKDIPGIDGFTTSDQEADEAFNADQERQARAAMISYQNGTNDQVMSVPQFAPPPTGEPDITIPTGNRSTIGGLPGGAGGGAVPGAPTPAAGVGGGTATELTAASTSTWSPSGGGPVVPPGGDGPGGPDGRRPAPPVLPAPVPSGPGVVPSTPVAGGPRGPGSGGRVGAGRGGPGAGMRGGPGVGGTGGFRPTGGGTGVGGFGPDRGGFGPTGSPESAAARAAGAGAAGAAGTGAARGAANAGGVPFGGMGGGRGGEDQERRRPTYLIEPDSNRLIGELPWTAPAVIGEHLPDDDEPTRR